MGALLLLRHSMLVAKSWWDLVNPYFSIKIAFKIGPTASPRPVAVTNILEDKLFTISGSKLRSFLVSTLSSISGIIGMEIIGEAPPSSNKPRIIETEDNLKPKTEL